MESVKNVACVKECNDRKNYTYVRFDAKSVNEGFARMVVAAFMMDLNPTLEEIADVKTAVSEAVTNAIVHGYQQMEGQVKVEGQVEMECAYEKEDNRKEIHICISDKGVGIENIDMAMQPFYTSKPDMERSGMGFAFMEAFMDKLEVESRIGEGTSVKMSKIIKGDCGE